MEIHLIENIRKILAIFFTLLLIGCQNSEKQINQLLFETTKLVEQAKQSEESDTSKALNLYKLAFQNLEQTQKDFPSSPLSLKVAENVIKVAGFSYDDIRNLIIPNLERRLSAEKDPLSCTDYLISHMYENSSEDKIPLLLFIANFQIEASRLTDAKSNLREALRLQETLLSEQKRIPFLLQIAATYRKANNKDKPLELTFRALSLTKQIKETELREESLREVARSYFSLGTIHKGLEALQSISHTITRERILLSLALDLINQKRFEDAFSTSNTIFENSSRAEFLLTLAGRITEEGDPKASHSFLDAVFQILPSIRKKPLTPELTVQLARLYRKAGNSVRTSSLLEESLHLVEKSPHPSLKILSKIANEYALIQKSSEVRSAVAWALKLLPQVPTQGVKEQFLLALSIALSRIGDHEHAQKLFSIIKFPYYRGVGLTERSEHFWESGNKSTALNMLAEAQKIITVLEKEEKDRLITSIIKKYLKMDEFDRAIEALITHTQNRKEKKLFTFIVKALLEKGRQEQTLSVIHHVQDPILKALLLSEVAVNSVSQDILLQDNKKALGLMEDASTLAIENHQNQLSNLPLIEYLLGSYLKIKSPDNALNLLQKTSPPNRAYWLIKIADSYTELKQITLAIPLLQNSLDLLAQLETSPSQLQALAEIASVYRKASQEPDDRARAVLRSIISRKI